MYSVEEKLTDENEGVEWMCWDSERRSEFIDRLSGLVYGRCCRNRGHSAIHIVRCNEEELEVREER